MFPPSVVLGLMSLRADGDSRAAEVTHPNPALSVRLRFADDGAIAEHEVVPASLRPVSRLTYAAVDAVLDGDAAVMSDAGEPTCEVISRLYAAADRRAAYRASRGATMVRLPKSHITVERGGSAPPGKRSLPTLHVRPQRANRARRLVEELMIAAAEAVRHAAMPRCSDE